MGIAIKRLGVLLAAGPVSKGFIEARVKIEEALREGYSVYLYAVDEGVLGLAEWQKLKGVHCFGCAFSARQRELELEESIIYGGLSLLSDLWASVEWAMNVTKRGGCSSIIEVSQEPEKKRKILLEVTGDLRIEEQSREAIRIAAGVQVWHRVDINLLFRGEGVICLDEKFLIENEVIRKDLTLLEKEKSKFLADYTALKEQDITPTIGVDVLSVGEIDRWEKTVSWTVVF
ncbi:MAG: hypothetical protein K1X66_05025 [Verrucomicrobiae bacterium]|nr:hypothetical protein [Verrucomicrobiae bacterium]